MDPSGDDLAGVVDLFGALTRAELGQALAELAFKRGQDAEPETFDDVIDDALHTYHLVAVPAGAVSGAEVDADLLVPGPVAFPTLPEDAADLPHIMDVSTRSPARETVGTAAEERFRADAAAAVDAGEAERVATLLDVSYELEVWAPVDLDAAREQLDRASE
jgi:hypothetical protein